LTSCDKWLEVDLADKVTEEKMFSTPQGYQEALAGVYSAMAGPNLYGRKLSMEYIDILAQYYNYGGIAATYEKWKNYDYADAGSEAQLLSIWRGMYSGISGAN